MYDTTYCQMAFFRERSETVLCYVTVDIRIRVVCLLGKEVNKLTFK
jgi:hypothetical protein